MERPQETHHHTSPGIQTIGCDAYGVTSGTSSPAPSPHTEEDNAPPIEPHVQPIEHHQSDPQIDRHQSSCTDAAPDA